MPIKNLICIDIKKNGRTFHLSDSEGNQTDVSNAEDLFNFLLLNAEKPNTAKACWNLFQLFAILDALLPKEVTEKIIKEDRSFFGDYKIFSSSGKVLSIGFKKHLHDNFYASRIEVNIYGLRQYFPDDNINDLYGLKSKGDELMNTLKELGWETNTLSSAIAIYDDAVLEKEFIPSVYDMEDTEEVDGMLDYAYKLMCREWRSIYKIGNFTNAIDIDIISGYPSFIKDFGNTSECDIQYSKKLIKSDFGICKGIVHINKDYSPIVNPNGQNVIGSYEDYITTEQWAYIIHYGIGSFDMEDGYFLNFYDKEDKPFFDLMTNQYNMREHGGLRKTLAKNISVGIYGYQSQEYPEKYGNYFNPIYSVMTTSRCSLKIGKLIEEFNLKDNLISVTVDGLLTTKDIELDTTKQIGGWKKEKVDALILSCGHQYITNHANENKKDTYQNTYDKMITEINNHPNKVIYNNVLLNKNMSQTNRLFRNFPKNGRELSEKIYTSEPICVGEK